jgi:hypothetical protein
MATADNGPPGGYKSDRWLTPGVLIALIIVAGVILAVVAGGMAYLTAQGYSPDPMLKYVGLLGTGLFTGINLLLTMSGRATTTKIERNTGVLPSVAGTVYDVADHLAAAAASAPTASLPPVPAPTTHRAPVAYPESVR